MPVRGPSYKQSLASVGEQLKPVLVAYHDVEDPETGNVFQVYWGSLKYWTDKGYKDLGYKGHDLLYA